MNLLKPGSRLRQMGVRCGALAGVAWNPSRLSGLAVTLLPALSRSQGKLWQNAAKTTPATADGDPVRVAVCPFTAKEWTAASDAVRPLLWDEGGGKWSLFYDGVDDILVGPSQSSGAGWTVGGRNIHASPALNYITVSLNAAAVNNGWRVQPASVSRHSLTFATVAVYLSGKTYTANAYYTRLDRFTSSGTWRMRSTGNTESSVAVGALAWSGSPRFTAGGYSGSVTELLTGRIAGLVVATGEASDADATSLETYLGAL